MANRPANLTQAEIARAVRGAEAAGLAVGRLEVDYLNRKVLVWPVGAAGADASPIDAMIEAYK